MSSKTRTFKSSDLGSNLIKKCWVDGDKRKVFIKFGDDTLGVGSINECANEEDFDPEDAIARTVLAYILKTYGDMEYDDFMDACFEKANEAEIHKSKWKKFFDEFFDFLAEQNEDEEDEDEEDDVEEETESEEDSDNADDESEDEESNDGESDDEKSDADEELEKKWNTLVDEIEELLKILDQPKPKRNAASIWETLWR